MAVYLVPLGLFCILWWWMPANVRENIRDVFVDVQAPVYNAALDTNVFIARVKKNLVDKNTLLAEYEKLARMNLYLQVCIEDLVNTSQSLPATQRSVFEDVNTRFSFIYANVVRRDLANWSDELVINRGVCDGIHVGDGVIAGSNVVGRIKRTYRDLSVVELLSAPTFRISACLENDDFPIIFHGSASSGFLQYSGLAENIITNLSEHKPQNLGKIRLVSSYLSGIFPGGMTIGYISKLDDIYNGMFTKVPVELDADFINNLHEVVVLSQLQVE